jgi:cystathionine gamma-synthase
VTERIEDNLWKVARYLEAHPEVSAVHWSRGKASGETFAGLARRPHSAGGMLSFEVKLPLAAFYDALPLPKGPSFGMSTTLVCPFIWLGHYDLVTSAEGRARLAQSGINPDLVRMAVGTEPPEEIIQALEQAFAEAARAR